MRQLGPWPTVLGLAGLLVVVSAFGLEGAWHGAKKAQQPCAAQPCAPKQVCAAQPCAPKQPCAAQPCAPKQPCAAQPCAAKPAKPVKDKVAEATFKEYKGWTKVNEKPVMSATHGNTWVFTYVNKKSEGPALAGKFPLPAGAILAKESFQDAGGKPGARGALFVMEKRKKGYDPANSDWHYAVVNPDGTVAMSGSGKAGSSTQFCAGCHMSAKVNDFVFGNGTIMKVKPTAVQAPAQPCAAQPCAPKQPCAAQPCAPKK